MSRLRSIGMVTMILAAGVVGLSAQAKPATPATPATKVATQKAPKVTLPPAVDAAFKKAYPEATIKNVLHEKEDGQEQYEIESMDHAMHLDVNYKPDGTVLVVEQEVAAADVPAAVTAAITARYPKATIAMRERVIEKGATFFEISLKGGPSSVQLTPDGKWISPKPAK